MQIPPTSTSPSIPLLNEREIDLHQPPKSLHSVVLLPIKPSPCNTPIQNIHTHTQFLQQKIINPQRSASINRAITRTEIAMASRSAKVCAPRSITLTKSVSVKVSSRALNADILPTVYIAILSVMMPADKDRVTFPPFLRHVQ